MAPGGGSEKLEVRSETCEVRMGGLERRGEVGEIGLKGAGVANGAEESGCAGGENGAWLCWGWGGRGRLISGVECGCLMGARRSGRRVDWLVGLGDATHVGVGDLLGVDPR